MLMQSEMGYLQHIAGFSLSKPLHLASERTLYWMGRTMVDLFTRLSLDRDIAWHAPLPEGPKILAANHPTTTDPFYILTLTSEPVSVLVTGGAFDVPLFGSYLRQAGHIPVLRNSGGSTIRAATEKLRNGGSVAIFPEGSLSPIDGHIGFHPPHSGVARLALGTGAPVIPVGIGLQQEQIRFVETELDGKPESARLYPRGPYAMTVGEPLRFEGNVEDRDLVRSVSGQIMERIMVLSRESTFRIEAPQPALLESMAGVGAG